MSTDVAAHIIFGGLRDSYEKQQVHVDSLRLSTRSLESQFLLSVRNQATRLGSIITNQERMQHDELQQALNCSRIQLASAIKMLQGLRRRHNMAVINRKARTRYLAI
ncbi:hypothetical protein LPJ66_001993 [Kickxella alabastrina]|uniref:Uncharacterized protein n=1 Tax=Kickxella alabastrina TaxID=61397 RepID=A0ACC1IRR0_9FUNG|nr:hypothetical protein LPJ66_001993 [Kickxella alabastrina]